MNINNDWNEDNNTNQVNNNIVNVLVDEETAPVEAPAPVSIDEGNKFQVIDYSEALEAASNAKKITRPIMSKYEKAKIIGLRATQIAKGNPPLVDVKGLKHPFEKAEKELQEKKTPLIVRRVLPDGSYEDWKVEEFLF